MSASAGSATSTARGAERLSKLGRRAYAWCLETEGSTRSSALIRIGLAAILWSRWARELLLFRDFTPAGVVLSLSFFASTTLMFLGVYARFTTLCAALVSLTMYYYFGLELGRAPWTHHHAYLLAFGTLLCALTPCGSSYSVDRWRALGRAERRGEPPPPERGNLWGLRLVALQLSTIYFFSGAEKLYLGFLSGDRLEHYFMQYYAGSSFPEDPVLHAAFAVAACSTVALEFALVFLIFGGVRRWLVIPGLLLHGIFYMLLPVSTFTATMWCLYLAYFDSDRVHATIDRISGQAPQRTDANPKPAAAA